MIVVALVQARADLAAAVQSIDPALNIRTRVVKHARANDGWVIFERVAPGTSSLTGCDVTMTAVVLLGADETNADDRFLELCVPAVNAVTRGQITNTAAVTCEPAVVLVGDPGAPMYALILTVTMEVG